MHQCKAKRYGSELALDYIDYDVYKGEIVGLLGPKGAGKTTLIHTGVYGLKGEERKERVAQARESL